MRSFTFKTYTFGCRVNQAETRQIEENLLDRGFQLVRKNELADLMIINTCVITQKAEKEVRQLARRVRRENPQSFLILCGCGVNFWYRVGFPKLPVDLFIKNEQKLNIVNILKRSLKRANHASTIILDRNIVTDYKRPYSKLSRQIIKIQDGCNKFCSFCIVPYLRGKPKSKKISHILKEARKAKKRGVKEIILSGINLGLFGQDTDETIPELLETLLKKTSLPRISFGSIYPEVISDKFIKLYVNDWQSGANRLAPFFHLPLQSGSEKILKLMGRRYSLEKFKSIVKKLHKALPHALIATDVIVGFPGEGEKEFQETYQFLTNAPIFKLHVFRFSPRNGTIAAKMEKEWGRVDEREKKKRSRMLINLSDKKYRLFLDFPPSAD